MTGDKAPVPDDEVIRYFADTAATRETGVYDVQRIRENARAEGLAVRGGLEPVGSVEDTVLDGVPSRLYRPDSAPGTGGPVFVWIHGGGWMHGDLDIYDGMARALANAATATVAAVDYRLAPEHPFPAGLDDAWSVTRWAGERFDSVVVAGDSSGANIAAAIALRARDSGVGLDGQLLFYPMLDSRETEFKKRFRDRYADFAGQPGFGTDTYDRIKFIWETYVPDPGLRESPLVAPLLAQDLHGLAPAVIVTAEHDILRDEGQAYARRLHGAGVDVDLLDFPGQVHGFLQMRGVLSGAQQALEAAVAALDRLVSHSQAR